MSDFAKTIIYGKPGAGKTSLLPALLDIPSALPVLVFDFDNKTHVIKSRRNFVTLDNWEEELVEDKINVLPFKEISNNHTPQESLNILNRLINTIGRSNTVSTLVIDTITSMGEIILAYSLTSNKANRFHPKVPVMVDYGVIGALQVNIMRELFNMDHNVLILTHVHTDEQINFDRPNFLGAKARETAPSMAHQIGFLHIVDNTRRITWKSNSYCLASDGIEVGVDEPLSSTADLREIAHLFVK